ncbi:MAG: hypothetical protein ACPGSM_05050 [Thiolinea sp.]
MKGDKQTAHQIMAACRFRGQRAILGIIIVMISINFIDLYIE